MKTISISNLRTKISEILDELEKTQEPVVIIRNSRPVAYLVEYGQYEEFCNLRKLKRKK